MKTKLFALLAAPFLTVSLQAQEKPASPASPSPSPAPAPAPAAPEKPGKKEDAPKVAPEDAFKKADANSDASLSLEEFKALPRFKKDNSKAEEIFKKKDTDTDSKLSLEEFKAKPALAKGKGKGKQDKAEKKAAEPRKD
ncbi:MAG: EF-hand domain-containing protein [Verrucomicrobiota bacterium]